MIARNKPIVCAGIGTEPPLLGRSHRNFVCVLLSYRTFSQAWAFHPYVVKRGPQAGAVGLGTGRMILEHLAAPGGSQSIELERKVLVLRADPRIADVRHSRSVRFPVRVPGLADRSGVAGHGSFDGHPWL